MPRLSIDRNPSLRRHTASGQGIVTLSGRDHYLGRWPADQKQAPAEVQAEYDRLISEWRAGGRRPLTPTSDGTGLTINELILAFWEHAEQHYRHPDGTPTTELKEYRYSLRPLRELYGHTPARDFGPLALKAVRQRMVEAGQCRNVVNQRIGRVKRMFRWGASEELVPAAVVQALATVAGLPKGRSPARESEPVQPVPEPLVEAVLPLVLPPVRAMIRLQLLTGMRPGEACAMRPCDIDMTGATWLYRPALHKTAWRGKGRVIALGPKAQAIVREFLPLKTDDFLFSPARAVAAWHAERRARRKTRVQPSQAYRRKPNPKRKPAEVYSAHSYAHAITKACRRAGVPHWHPNQLRHNFATAARRRFGLEAAQVLLGHSKADVTQVYAERDLSLAVRVAAECG
jgi:integrase